MPARLIAHLHEQSFSLRTRKEAELFREAMGLAWRVLGTEWGWVMEETVDMLMRRS